MRDFFKSISLNNTKDNKVVSLFEILQEILACTDEMFIKSLVENIDRDNNTIFTKINVQANAKTLIELLDWMDKILGATEFRTLLKIENKYGENFYAQVETSCKFNNDLMKNVLCWRDKQPSSNQ